jgi:hypothetical protein
MGNRGSMLLSELVSVFFSDWVSHGPGCDKLLSTFSVMKLYAVTDAIHCWYLLTLSDPTLNLIRQYDFPVLLRCRKTSNVVFVAFVRPLSEPVWRFSSCSTDFSQQMVQVVLFLFLYVFFFENCRIITSNPPTSFSPKTSKSWGVCGWQKNWIGKG